MTKRIGGFRRKTRSKLKKTPRTKGKISLSKFMQEFKMNDKVVLHADSGYQKGMYLPRFHGKSGTIVHKRGACYLIRIKDGGKVKDLIVHPVHLKRS